MGVQTHFRSSPLCSLVSVYSKAFYTYMTAICEGALNNFDNLLEYKEEILGLLRRPGQKVRSVI